MNAIPLREPTLMKLRDDFGGDRGAPLHYLGNGLLSHLLLGGGVAERERENQRKEEQPNDRRKYHV
jgi:hypothetical protein